jgi:DNA/RNA-binding domain of Phe-tRNA-synthetase-like protein
MYFSVAEECVRLGLRSGAIVFRSLQIGDTGPALRAEIASEVQAIRLRFADPGAVRAAPEVVAFQGLLRKVGVNPRKLQPSVERLLTFVLKRGELPAVNSLVEAYNLVSVRSLCSLGAHDLDRFTPPVALRILNGAESFTPLGQEAPSAVVAGEFGYVDADNRVLCRLDVLQADFSKVTHLTRNVLLIVEGTPVHSAELLRKTFDEVIERVTRHCGGTAEVVAFPAGL